MAAEIGGRGGKGGMVHGVRSLGSATLDLAYCALGAFVGVGFDFNRVCTVLTLRRRTSGGKVDAGKPKVFSVVVEGPLTTTREWDVAAGICLLQEAGGLITTANPPENIDSPIQDASLGGRLYLAIRPAGDSPTESGQQGQERTVREVWRRARLLDYTRPGV